MYSTLPHRDLPDLPPQSCGMITSQSKGKDGCNQSREAAQLQNDTKVIRGARVHLLLSCSCLYGGTRARIQEAKDCSGKDPSAHCFYHRKRTYRAESRRQELRCDHTDLIVQKSIMAASSVCHSRSPCFSKKSSHYGVPGWCHSDSVLCSCDTLALPRSSLLDRLFPAGVLCLVQNRRGLDHCPLQSCDADRLTRRAELRLPRPLHLPIAPSMGRLPLRDCRCRHRCGAAPLRVFR
jgi:hypothetical protein